MNVLVLHSWYRSGPSSGENRVVEDEVRLLREGGHRVTALTPTTAAGTSSVRLAADAIWSRSAVDQVRAALREEKPDVVHVHSLYPRLSPAVLRCLPARVPIVLTLHNFRLMCLPATYLRDGAICEACAGRLPWRGVVHACYRSSHGASAALAASLVVHRALRTYERVDLFLAVSEFVRRKHVEAGLGSERVRVKPNFAWPAERRIGPGGLLLFVGRVTPEKGLETIIGAAPPDMDVLVVGDGPDRARLERPARGRVTFVGQVDASEVPSLMRTARALVVPSRWYEGQPRAILEAFACGVPVVASRIGGLPELVEDGVNGFLVETSQPSAWRETLERLADDGLASRLGDGARATWERRFTPEIALRELEAVYESCSSGRLAEARPSAGAARRN